MGKSTDTCFGIDVRDKRVLSKHFDLNGELTLRKVLAKFGSAVTYSTKKNILCVQVGHQKKDWLDVVMPSFQASELPPESVSDKLFTWLNAQADPRSGAIGSGSFTEKGELVRAFELKDVTVSTAIATIIANTAGGGLWFTTEQHPAQDALPSHPFWTILIYAESTGLSDYRLSRAIGASQ